MSTVSSYSPEQFNSLPSFSQAQANLGVVHDSLAVFGRVLQRHGLSNDVGLALLHRHFDLEFDEILVETVIPLKSESIGSPRVVGGSAKALPHLFRTVFDPTSGDYVWYPTEFVDAQHDDGTLAARYANFAAHAEFLKDMADVLQAEGALDAIGLSLFHGREKIFCDDDEVLVESTDDIERTLVMRPGKCSAVNVTSTPTLWRFDGEKVLMACTCQTDANGNHGHYETN
jgi:hypothetical protein